MTSQCSALIVVLGDLGRSPRMLNHARALRARGWEVTLAGYNQTSLPPDFVSTAGTSRSDCSYIDPPAVRVMDLLTAGAACEPSAPLRQGSAAQQSLAVHHGHSLHTNVSLEPSSSLEPLPSIRPDPPARPEHPFQQELSTQPGLLTQRGTRAQPGLSVRSDIQAQPSLLPKPRFPAMPGHAAKHASFLRLSTALLRLLRELQRRPWTAVIVQNPPGFPALAICALAASPGTSIVLDWHNLGGTLLALRTSDRRRWAPLYSWCEAHAACFADYHWAVSAALGRSLKRRTVTVVYDRPAKVFCAAAQAAAGGREDRLAWWRRVLPDRPTPEGRFWIAAPSSWGPDEDHGAMLHAAEYWKINYLLWGDAPPITIIATGKGPGQAEFARAASAFDGGPVTLQTAWIPAEEYPAFLAHADAGLCLHRSSSGLDLPMKLADFRGARIPALVLDYGPVLAETLRPGQGADGWTFRSAQELAQTLRAVTQSHSELPVAADASAANRAQPTAPTVLSELAEPTTSEDEWERQLGAWASVLEKRETAACI